VIPQLRDLPSIAGHDGNRDIDNRMESASARMNGRSASRQGIDVHSFINE